MMGRLGGSGQGIRDRLPCLDLSCHVEAVRAARPRPLSRTSAAGRDGCSRSLADSAQSRKAASMTCGPPRRERTAGNPPPLAVRRHSVVIPLPVPPVPPAARNVPAPNVDQESLESGTRKAAPGVLQNARISDGCVGPPARGQAGVAATDRSWGQSCRQVCWIRLNMRCTVTRVRPSSAALSVLVWPSSFKMTNFRSVSSSSSSNRRRHSSFMAAVIAGEGSRLRSPSKISSSVSGPDPRLASADPRDGSG